MFVPHPFLVPINQQEALAPVVTRLLKEIDSGLGTSPDAHFYTFSPLRSRNRAPDRDSLRLGPGVVQWTFSTTSSDLARHVERRLRALGRFEVDGAELPIASVERFTAPQFGPTAFFTCAAPIVIGGSPLAQLAEMVRAELVRKYESLNGRPPRTSALTIELDNDYVGQRRWTKRVSFGGSYVEGIYCPFTVRGSPHLIRLGYLAGFGLRTEDGFGMVL
jgi:CRISPR-associated endoribonuclease Cas6